MPTQTVRRSRTSTKRSPKHRKLSRTHKPVDMELHEWQMELRRQLGRE